MSSARLSRRALTTGAACSVSVAALAIGANASPSGMQSSTEVDPIFDLIEAHVRAFVVYEKVCHERSLAEEQVIAEIGSLTPVVQVIVQQPEFYFSRGGRDPIDLLNNTTHVEARTETRRAASHEQIDELLKTDRAQAEFAHADLDRKLSRKAEIMDTAKAAQRDISDAYAEALSNLFERAPTSLAGLIALMRHLRSTTSDGEVNVFNGDEDFGPLLDSIERSVCAFGGITPQPAEIV
jgi:hypothetical protein